MGTAFMIGFYMVFYLFVLAFSAVSYVLQGLGMFTVAKRRQINKPWLAWVPVGNMWMLGCISDQYRYVTQGTDRNFRKKLLWLMISLYIALVPMYMMEMGMILAGEMGMGDGAVIVLSILTILFALVVIVVAVFASVIQYMAIYDYFRSCEPRRAVLYLVLSIVVSVAFPILFFIVRNKDLGMPPKADEVPVIE